MVGHQPPSAQSLMLQTWISQIAQASFLEQLHPQLILVRTVIGYFTQLILIINNYATVSTTVTPKTFELAPKQWQVVEVSTVSVPNVAPGDITISVRS